MELPALFFGLKMPSHFGGLFSFSPSSNNCPLKKGLLLQFPRGGACHAMHGHTGGGHQDWSEGVREKHGPEPLLWFLLEGMGEAGEASRAS